MTMKNEERAGKIIADVFRPLLKGSADGLGRDLAAHLAKEGLLAPDPNPERNQND